MELYDLSLPLDARSGDPLPPRIEYRDHRQGVHHLARLLGVAEEDVPDDLGSAVEVVTARTHNGTHMDAPWHFYPTSEGKPARTIDQIPLEWCFGPGVVLDFSAFEPGYEIGVEDLEREIARVGCPIEPGTIVLVRTDAYKHYYSPDYPLRHPGMSAEATLALIERGVRVMGIDAWSWDVPLPLQGERFRREGRKDRSKLWAAHRVGRDREYVHLEQMANFDLLPRPFGFKVCVFPIKVKSGSAGWVRAVAIFDGASEVGSASG